MIALAGRCRETPSHASSLRVHWTEFGEAVRLLLRSVRCRWIRLHALSEHARPHQSNRQHGSPVRTMPSSSHQLHLPSLKRVHAPTNPRLPCAGLHPCMALASTLESAVACRLFSNMHAAVPVLLPRICPLDVALLALPERYCYYNSCF